MDLNLHKHLQSKDEVKKKKSIKQKSKKGKKVRGEKKYVKVNKTHKEWIEQ